MNADLKTLKDSLRAFSGACNRLADDPRVCRQPNNKIDFTSVYQGELQDAVQSMQRLVTIISDNG